MKTSITRRTTKALFCALPLLLVLSLSVSAYEKSTGLDSELRLSAQTRTPVLFLGDEVLIANWKTIELRLRDRISDGCWPRPGTAKAVVELALRRNGLALHQEGDPSPTLWLEGVGGAITCGCVAAISLCFTRAVLAKVAPDEPSLALLHTQPFCKRSLMTGPKSDMNEDIRDQFEEWANEFVLAVMKARGEIFKLRPDIKEQVEKLERKQITK